MASGAVGQGERPKLARPGIWTHRGDADQVPADISGAVLLRSCRQVRRPNTGDAAGFRKGTAGFEDLVWPGERVPRRSVRPAIQKLYASGNPRMLQFSQ